jgi:response regulator NasT
VLGTPNHHGTYFVDLALCSSQRHACVGPAEKFLRIVIVDDSGLRANVLQDGLREAGYDDIHVVPPKSGFVARLERMAPDVVLIDLGSPSRDTLEEMLAVSRALARPIAMFVDQSDDTMIGAAIDAGVSAYVVDGLRKERVKPVLDLAIRRFNAFARMQTELDAAKNERDQARIALHERKTIDRAKAILMTSRKLSETDAYALLRSTAMNQGKRIVEVAEALITASDLLGGSA